MGGQELYIQQSTLDWVGRERLLKIEEMVEVSDTDSEVLSIGLSGQGA